MTQANSRRLGSLSRLLSSRRRFYSLLGLFLIAGSLFVHRSKLALVNSTPYFVGKSSPVVVTDPIGYQNPVRETKPLFYGSSTVWIPLMCRTMEGSDTVEHSRRRGILDAIHLHASRPTVMSRLFHGNIPWSNQANGPSRRVRSSQLDEQFSN